MNGVYTFLVLAFGTIFALVTVGWGVVHLALALAWLRWRDMKPEFHYPLCLAFALLVFILGQYKSLPPGATAVANYVALFGVFSEATLLLAAGLFAVTRRMRRGHHSGATV
jgi:hypothetical protein